MNTDIIKTCGIICEYNPFHIGHQYHLQKAREKSKADLIICLLSGPFTQRGTAAFFHPTLRAHSALLNGADVVFELPTTYALREAEFFAYGSIKLLSQLGVESLSFGCESEDLSSLQKIAVFLNQPPPLFNNQLKALLNKGLSFPKAQHEALKPFFSPTQLSDFSHPNNILAITYLRAIHEQGLFMNLYPVHRVNNYHKSNWETLSFPSATALRSAFYRRDWKTIEKMTPTNTLSLLKEALYKKQYHLPDALDLPLLYVLRQLSFENLSSYQLEPGLDYKIFKSSNVASSRKELVHLIKSKRYTYSRINRTLTQILLGMDSTTALFPSSYIQLLGFNKKALPWLKYHKNQYVTKPGNAEKNLSFELNMKAYDLWALGAGLPKGLGYKTTPVVL